MSRDEREEKRLPSSFEAPGCEQLNELLPAFKFRELIACGGMGAVYRARQVSLGRDVAIKVLPPEVSAAGSVFVESFKTEARTMASLNHPNLVGIHDFGEVSGMLYLVMEYIDGNALYRSIKGQKVKAAQAVKIVEEVARGLGHAHERGLLHRDIKPANILLNQKRKPVLGDFGLVVRSDAVGSGLNMGTPGYIAPEVVGDFEAASTASDVYGLGMILHEMLSGVMPTGKQAPDLTLVPELNGLRGLVGRLVSSDPSQRPADGEALAEELANWLEGAQRMKGLVLSPAATMARTAQPTVLAPGRGRIPLGPAGAGRTASKSWWGPGVRALVVGVLAVVGIVILQREEEPAPEQVEQLSEVEEVVPGPRKQPPTPAPGANPSPAAVEPVLPKASDFKWAVQDGKVTVTKFVGKGTRAVIPRSIEGKPVTSIGVLAFDSCTSLTSITIPDSVTSIGSRAFGVCMGLTSITIPDSVTSIGGRAFVGCVSLRTITIPAGVTSIGVSAFDNCRSLTSIAVGTGSVNYTHVDGVLFNKEKTLVHSYPAAKTDDSYAIPGSVIRIGQSAFSHCIGLMSIEIPDSVTSIGAFAFDDCRNLTSITIGNSVTSIEGGAFGRCTSLTSIEIPDSVTYIDHRVFDMCSSLTAVTFLGDAPKASEEVFKKSSPTIYRKSGAKGWGDTWAGRPVKLIGERSQRPTSPQPATMSAFQVVKGSFTWHEAKADAEKRGGRLAVLNTAEKIKGVNAALDKLGVWPDLWIGLTDEKKEGDWRWITGEALQVSNWRNAQPDNTGNQQDVCTIISNGWGEGAVWDDVKTSSRRGYLLELEVDKPAPAAGKPSGSGALSPEERGKLRERREAYLKERVAVDKKFFADPNGGLLAAYDRKLQAVEKQFTASGNAAGAAAARKARQDSSRASRSLEFAEIFSVQEVLWEQTDKLALRVVRELAKLIQAHLDDLSTIRDRLTKGGRPGAVAELEKEIAEVKRDPCCPAQLEDFRWQVRAGKVTITRFVGKGRTAAVPRSIEDKPVTAIGKEAFKGCSTLERVLLPDGLTSLGTEAFAGCSSLERMFIPRGVTVIPEQIFNGCSRLGYVALPEGVTVIGRDAFCACHSLTSIKLPDSLTLIGWGNFAHCSGLTRIRIPDGVTAIHPYAFWCCTNLTSITFGRGLKKFGGVDDTNRNLTEVIFLGDVHPDPQGKSDWRALKKLTFYRQPEAKSWGSTWGGRPVRLLNEKP